MCLLNAGDSALCTGLRLTTSSQATGESVYQMRIDTLSVFNGACRLRRRRLVSRSPASRAVAALEIEGGEQIFVKLEPDGMARINFRFVDPFPLAPVDPVQRGRKSLRIAGEP